ncbi:MAG: hypothetical protein CNE98_00095 [Bacteroidetes bacterium MED-G17]|nr:MAG: hypothetical protein CBB99_06450 [Bacteroidetes bacterium TMED39]PDH53493.1 MAG: hypothetical protein CNE98_00095 [Bacteroidetes bacterium MED-G17]
MKLETQNIRLTKDKKELLAFLSKPKNHHSLVNGLVKNFEATNNSISYEIDQIGSITFLFETLESSFVQRAKNDLPIPIEIQWLFEGSGVYCKAIVQTNPMLWTMIKGKIATFLEEQLRRLQKIHST